MKRVGRNLLFLAGACAAGLAAAELCYRTAWTRDAIGQLLGRGELLALVRGFGIYEHDLLHETDASPESLILAENLRHVASTEPIANEAVERELDSLRHQFGDAARFAAALNSSRTSEPALRRDIMQHLQARQWIERQIAAELQVMEDELQRVYDQGRAEFQMPPRYRASHLFLAAPESTPPEITAAKRKAMKDLAGRNAKGEPLAQLALGASEDEATKANGGDLGFFSAARALPEFFAQVEKLRVGQISPPFQSSLGFHLAQLTEVKPPRELMFAEVREEIARRLRNEERAAAVSLLAERLQVAEFVRPES